MSGNSVVRSGSGSSGARSSSSTSALVRKHDDFVNLCELLRRNDPTLLSASTKQISRCGCCSATMRARIEQFCLALENNTILKSLWINPLDLQTSCDATTGVRTIDPLVLRAILCFIEHNPSLLSFELDGTYGKGPRLHFIQMLVEAMVKNPSIRSFQSSLSLPPSILETLVSSHRGLRRLAIPISEESSVGGVNNAAARLIGSHPALEDISLRMACRPANASAALSPFLQCLQSHGTMQCFHLTWSTDVTPPVILLSKIFETSKKLKKVSLASMSVDGEQWKLISNGLSANPNIDHLTLELFGFTEDATSLLLTELPSNNIRTLRLSYCRLLWKNRQDLTQSATELSRLLRQLHIRHVSLDTYTLADVDLMHFFDVLSTGDSSVDRPRSMEILRMGLSVLQQISLYIARTVWLRSLRVQISYEIRDNDVLCPISREFLSTVRGNGSLYKVQITSRYGGVPTRRVRRFIRACTRRNRALPKLLSTVFAMGKSSTQPKSSSTVATTGSSLSQRFPTLCTSAMQAPLMAPNNVFIGLLASLETLVPSKRERAGKRILAQTRPLGEAL